MPSSTSYGRGIKIKKSFASVVISTFRVNLYSTVKHSNLISNISPYPAVHDNPYLCKQCKNDSEEVI